MTTTHKTSFVDCILEKLPDIHLPGYNFCGPNTNLSNRTHCVNDLDCACKEHDIAYGEHSDIEMRYIADKILVLKAIRRMIAKDARMGERFSALLVTSFICVKMILIKIEMYLMKIKSKFKCNRDNDLKEE